MKTLQTWINAHPGVNVLAFERNPDKSFGFGESEEVCGFCLASHYFAGEPPEFCKFCRAPLRETHSISDLPEITNRIYNFGWLHVEPAKPERKLPFIVPKDVTAVHAKRTSRSQLQKAHKKKHIVRDVPRPFA